jgi:hypothetical protein
MDITIEMIDKFLESLPYGKKKQIGKVQIQMKWAEFKRNLKTGAKK